MYYLCFTFVLTCSLSAFSMHFTTHQAYSLLSLAINTAKFLPLIVTNYTYRISHLPCCANFLQQQPDMTEARRQIKTPLQKQELWPNNRTEGKDQQVCCNSWEVAKGASTRVGERGRVKGCEKNLYSRGQKLQRAIGWKYGWHTRIHYVTLH